MHGTVLCIGNLMVFIMEWRGERERERGEREGEGRERGREGERGVRY